MLNNPTHLTLSKNKAHEMVAEQTIIMCRLNGESDLIKSILVSSVFSKSKDVVAKLVIEQATENKEHQILSFRANNRNFKNDNNFNQQYCGNQRYVSIIVAEIFIFQILRI